MFHGSIVAIVTPMKEDGAIDFDGFRQLIDWHLASGTDGIVVLGTTGESPTIEFHEREQLLQKAVEWVGGRVPVIAGTGSNSTKESIRLTQHAMEAGIDACLVVTPYYNKPTQEGLFQHFKAIAEAVAIPLILYNVPGRTGCDLLPETMGRLSLVPNIVGLKEATGDLNRVNAILEQCNKEIDLLSGDDATARDFIFKGGKGVISVTANVAPRLMHEMCTAALTGDQAEANRLNAILMPLHQQLFVEANPIPVKWALTEMKKIPNGIRLPLTVLAENKRNIVRDAMRAASI